MMNTETLTAECPICGREGDPLPHPDDAGWLFCDACWDLWTRAGDRLYETCACPACGRVTSTFALFVAPAEAYACCESCRLMWYEGEVNSGWRSMMDDAGYAANRALLAGFREVKRHEAVEALLKFGPGTNALAEIRYRYPDGAECTLLAACHSSRDSETTIRQRHATSDAEIASLTITPMPDALERRRRVSESERLFNLFMARRRQDGAG